VKYSNIDDIIQPCTEELPVSPCVYRGEKISRAIELMVHQNVDCIAVVQNRQVIGMIRLEDAFSKVGLAIPFRY